MLRKLISGVLLAIAVAVALVGFTTNHAYVTTPSMYPRIPPGSEVFIQREQTYRVGDVIEFRGNGLTWVHRLVKINPGGSYVTKGDNPENAPDVFVPARTQADVIGKVVFAPSWIGFPELIVHHPGYGLAWLRAELGLKGKVIVVLFVGLLAWLARKPARHRPAHRLNRTHAVPLHQR